MCIERVVPHSDRVRQLRNARGLRQRGLARLSGLGLRTIQKIEAWKPVEVKSLMAVAPILRTNFRSLILRSLKKQKPHSLDRFQFPASNLPRITQDVLGRAEMRRRLSRAWEAGSVNVVEISGVAGIGKTALVTAWLEDMKERDYAGAERGYGWSFYGQSASGRETPTEVFVTDALRRFKDKHPEAGSLWQRGERLARCIQSRKTLLVLDGLEPILDRAGDRDVRIRDPAVRMLLYHLIRSNPGLCVITTRYPCAMALSHRRGLVKSITLEKVTKAAGAKLLSNLGVAGTNRELEAASEEYRGHPLALTLLGTYLRKVHGGGVRRRADVSLMRADELEGGHARRVLRSYESWLRGGPELALLYVLGLFSRPAGRDAIHKLSQPPVIAQLTDTLVDKGAAELEYAISNLRELRLLGEADRHDPDALDTHPIIREFFGERIRKSHLTAWRAAHQRLFNHFRSMTPDLPDSLDAIIPLYDAVTHGCYAEQYRSAFRDVYLKRICRGKQYHNIRNIGAFGYELAALSGFFKKRWQRPVSALGDDDRAHIFNLVGTSLRATGRFHEAMDAIEAALNARIRQHRWEAASRNACTLSELNLLLGRLEAALRTAVQAVKLADKSRDPHMRVASRTVVGHIHHLQGNMDHAQRSFDEALRRQRGRRGDSPFLYGFQAFRYYNFLLTKGDITLVHELAPAALDQARGRSGSVIDQALMHLCIAEADLCLARAKRHTGLQRGVRSSKSALSAIRDIGRDDYLPGALILDADYWRLQQTWVPTKERLDEAFELVNRDPRAIMKLHLVDCYLGYARLFIAEGKVRLAKKHLTKAQGLIAETGYFCRKAALNEAWIEVRALSRRAS